MTKPRGGHRPNAGALVQSVELSKEDWRTLRTILLARYGKADKETVNIFFAGVIRQEWQAYDEMIQEKSTVIQQGEMKMRKLTSITVNVDFDTIGKLTGMTTEQIEEEEGNIDYALDYAFSTEFSEAEEVKASCGYVSELTVQAYDGDNDPVNVDKNRVNKAIRSAMSSL